MTTRNDIANQLGAYLNHKSTLAQLVDWAENAMVQGGINDPAPGEVMDILGRIAAADAQGFGLLWEDCDAMIKRLGYSVAVQVKKAA